MIADKLEGRLIPMALALAMAFIGAHAEASPTIWERIASPEAVREEALRRDIEALLFEVELLGAYSKVAGERLELARIRLEAADADKAKDIRLRFHFGRILGLVNEYHRSAEVLEAAIRDAPSHPLANPARFRLAIAYTWLGRQGDEITLYDEFLDREIIQGARAVALSNRAEAKMAIGDLEASIVDYRASLSLHPDAVARLGLAVALDRSGDWPGALSEASRALAMDPDGARLRDDGIFFVPDYERAWYEGLRAMARAEEAESREEALIAWRAGAAFFRFYIERAEEEDDGRWVAIARARRERCEREGRGRGRGRE